MKNLLFFILLNLAFLSYNLTKELQKDILRHNTFMEQSTKNLELAAKKALITYISQVILNKENNLGINIRAAILDHLDDEARKKAEQEILSQAENFPNIINKINQNYPWQLKQSKDVNNPCLYYSGMIFGLAVEIEFEKDDKTVSKVYIEVD
ncbi:MAG: hypothetical protein WAQ98_11875 [Blastocatellia bacterium]